MTVVALYGKPSVQGPCPTCGRPAADALDAVVRDLEAERYAPPPRPFTNPPREVTT